MTRSSSPRWSTTPTSCRGRCSRSAPARRCKWFGVTDEGRLDLSGLPELVTERTKIVSIAHQSNVLGTVNPVAEVLARAREVGALVMLDASQSVPHHPVDVAELDVDFVAFTGHKMVGPSGIGVLWGRGELLEAMPPFLGGGEMIEAVWMDHSTYAPVPHKFEAGTPPIVEAIGLGAAVDYLTGIGMDAVEAHEQELTAYALDALREVPALRLIGPDSLDLRGGTLSFTLAGIHPHDVGQILDDRFGIAVRVGHHCARPLHLRFGIPATTRASFYLYNTTARSTPWSAASTTFRRCSHSHDRRVDVPGTDPGALQAPAGAGAARAVRRRGSPREPDLRRRDHPAGQDGRRAARSRTSPTTGRAVRSARPPPRCCTS